MYRLVVDFDGSETAVERLQSLLGRNLEAAETALSVHVNHWQVHAHLPASGDDDDPEA